MMAPGDELRRNKERLELDAREAHVTGGLIECLSRKAERCHSHCARDIAVIACQLLVFFIPDPGLLDPGGSCWERCTSRGRY